MMKIVCGLCDNEEITDEEILNIAIKHLSLFCLMLRFDSKENDP